ncbi:unnamed protein product, partial [Pocillopora meandrina]
LFNRQHQLLISSLLILLSNNLHALEITTDDCGSGKGCFRFPESCTDDCNFLVTYNATGGDKVEFELSGKGTWVAVGFSDDREMTFFFAESTTTLSGHYYAEAESIPTKTNPDPAAVTFLEQANEGGMVKCRISRDINPGIANLRNLSQLWFLLGAVGDGDGEINYHGRSDDARQSTGSRVNVTSLSPSDASGGDSGINNIIVHGALMTLAWILFAFVGLFIARYMRQAWEPRELLGKKAWFTVHRTLMTTTVLLTIAGIIVIFVHKKEWSSNAGAHPYLGIIVLAFAIAQPIMAAFRPHPGEPRRNIFNWAHRCVGFTALILGVVTIYLGLKEFGLDREGLYAVISFYIGEFLVFMFELYLILSKRSREKKSGPINNGGESLLPYPSFSKLMSIFIYLQEKMIRTMMFVFVVLLGISVALTIILLMVLK